MLPDEKARREPAKRASPLLPAIVSGALLCVCGQSPDLSLSDDSKETWFPGPGIRTLCCTPERDNSTKQSWVGGGRSIIWQQKSPDLQLWRVVRLFLLSLPPGQGDLSKGKQITPLRDRKPSGGSQRAKKKPKLFSSTSGLCASCAGLPAGGRRSWLCQASELSRGLWPLPPPPSHLLAWLSISFLRKLS